jgi:hypothetical protein
VTGCIGSCPASIEIPAVLDGYSVTAIGDFALDNEALGLDGLVGVTIPSSVTVIGESAFENNSLTTVTLPNAVTNIGDYAFFGNDLTSVTIGNSVTNIGDYAFFGNDLTSVTIPNTVTNIGGNAFKLNALTTVTIGNSVTNIGGSAFAENRLTSVTIPTSVTTIGEYAFNSNALTALTIGSSVTTIGSSAFSANALGTVAIPNSVTSIGDAAFYNNDLTAVTIPNSVTSIGNFAFSANSRLTSVTFLGNAPTAGSSVFESTSLTSVTRTPTTTGWGSTWGGKPVVIATRATATIKPTITGTAIIGRTMTAKPGTWRGTPAPTYRYQWYACTKAVTAARSTVPSTCTAITGATRSTFKLTSAQRNKYVAVLVTGTSLGTTATAWLSKTTSKVS